MSGSIGTPAAIPLAPDESIVVLGWFPKGDETAQKQTVARYDDHMAACVRSAIGNASKTVRIVPLNQFRAAVGGTNWNSMFDDVIRNTLRDAPKSPAFTTLKIHYLFIVTGTTEESDFHDYGGGGSFAAGWSNSKRTQIEVEAWDLLMATKVTSFQTYATGVVGGFSAGLVINTLEYAPTESTACENTAEKILSFLSG